MEIEFSDKVVLVLLDKSIYHIEAIHKCFYWYGSEYSVSITSSSEEKYVVRLDRKDDAFKRNDNFLERRIRQDMSDFQLRYIVSCETRNVRDLLVAKAFANGELDEMPYGDASDPVGFDPKAVQNG